MNSSYTFAISRQLKRAPDILIPYRWVVLLTFLLITSFMIYGIATRFQIDMALESWFDEDDPAKVSLDQFRSQFGSDDGVYIVYQPKDGDLFSEKSIATLSRLHNALDEARLQTPADLTDDDPTRTALSRVERIDSLINARYQLGLEDQIIARKLIGSTLPVNSEAREAIRELAHQQRGFQLAYFSMDDQYGGIRIKTDFGTIPISATTDSSIEARAGAEDQVDDLIEFDETDIDDASLDEGDLDTTYEVEQIEYEDTEMNDYLYFMQALRAITEQSEYNHFRFYYTGNAPMMEFAMESVAESGLLTLGMVAVVIFLLWALFHSFSAVFWTLGVIIASAFWTVGIGSWLGVEFSNMVSLTFVMILAVGVADCVHVLSAYTFFRHEGLTHREAMSGAYEKTGIAILLTTITTMGGMVALTASTIPQIGVFGVSSALGVGLAFVMTLFVLPVMLDIWHPYTEKKRKGTSHHPIQTLLDKLLPWVSRHYVTVLIGYFALFALFVYGTSQVQIDSNFAELTREGSEIRVTYEVVDQHLMGANNMEIMLNFGSIDAVKSTKVLKAIDQLQQQIVERYPEYVKKSFSIADYVKETYQVLEQGNSAFYKIPDDDRLAAQLLYLFNNANAEDRRQLVSDDYSQTHISVQIRNAGSYEYSQFFSAVEDDIERIMGPLQSDYTDMSVNVTGAMALMMQLIDHMSWAQIKSFGFALIIITSLLVITLGTIQGGLVSMIPNLMPAIMTFGLMGLLGIPLDTDTLIIAPLIIGIAVDDTIHFMTHYRMAWMRCGDIDEALASTIKEVGQAVVFTTLILGVGFSLLAFSSYLGIAKTGIFGSLAIFAALSSDLLFLPALIKWLKPNLGRPEKAEGGE